MKQIFKLCCSVCRKNALSRNLARAVGINSVDFLFNLNKRPNVVQIFDCVLELWNTCFEVVFLKFL